MVDILQNIDNKSIFYNYAQQYLKFKKQYKTNKFICFIQVGSFLEHYSYEIKNDNFYLFNEEACKVSNLINMYRSQKSTKKPHSYQNPKMFGFPIHCKEKYINALLEHDYTIILILQRPDNKTIRDVIEKYTPGTNINNININQYIMCIYIHKYKDNLYSCGISIININANDNFFFECIDTDFNSNNVINTIIKINLQFNPAEFLIFNLTNIKNDKFVNLININNKKFSFNNNIDSSFKKVSFQKHFLEKFYPNDKLCDIIQDLNLHHYNDARLSFVLLLNYIFDHNQLILKNLQYPSIINFDNNLNLDYNTAEQLNIISNTYNKFSIVSLLDFTSTFMGKRFLKKRLLNPLNDIDKININYNLIEEMMNHFNLFEEQLDVIPDITRKFKKIQYHTLLPYELFNLNNSFSNVINILNIVKKFKLLNNFVNSEFNLKIKNIQSYITKFNSFFHLQNLKNCNDISSFSTNFFKKGIYSDIDSIIDELNDFSEYRNSFLNDINLFFKNNNVSKFECRIEKNLIYITNSKLKIFKKFNKNKDFSHKTLNSKQYLTSIVLEKYNKKEIALLKKLRELLAKYFYNYLGSLIKFKKLFNQIQDFISFVDFIKSGCKCAIKNKYVKPQIIDSDNSFFDIIDFKHPIIEKMNDDIPFVSNSLKLNNDNRALILSGLNGIGKSSILKNIGILIIIAQAGYFVPAKSMKFSPFNSILTRIQGNDNIFTNNSSYMIEMAELKNILNKSDDKSLILIDELCKGTEYLSAHSLTISVIKELINIKKSIFILTTHLHSIYDNHIIQDFNQKKLLLIKHLSIDKINNKIIFNRKLIPGKCNDLYGLEIAKALGINQNIINDAMNIRNNFIGIKKQKKSKYNSDVIIDKCNICGSTKNLEVDHIIEQKYADEDGHFNNDKLNFHKNNKHNLLVLCKKCHLKKTIGDLNISQKIQTSSGILLNTQVNYSNIINKLRNSGSSFQKIKNILKSDYNHDISIYKIKKLIV